LPELKEILRHYHSLLSEVDRWFADCSARYPEQIACGRGCSSCCRSLFDITLLDAALLRSGFGCLPEEVRSEIAAKALIRLEGVRSVWPEFSPPYILNNYPEEEWSRAMPEDDETPCVLLDGHGLCLLYYYRPLTCRLHGLPMVDRTGEVLHDEWCTRKFAGSDPLADKGVRGAVAALIRAEPDLIGRFNLLLTGVPTAEFDTLIPAALLVDWTRHERDLSLPITPHVR